MSLIKYYTQQYLQIIKLGHKNNLLCVFFFRCAPDPVSQYAPDWLDASSNFSVDRTVVANEGSAKSEEATLKRSESANS